MLIIGCDFHSRFQQIAMLDTTDGEIIERRLEHETRRSRERFMEHCRLRPAWASKPPVDTQWFRKHARTNMGTNFGLAMRRRSARRWCGSKRPTDGMLRTSWTCCSRIVFRASGFLRQPSGICGNCCGIASNWCGFEPR